MRFETRGSDRVGAFEERVAVGVEEAAAVAGHADAAVLDAAVDGAEGGEQSRPGVEASLEHLDAVPVGLRALELGAERRDRVALGPGAVVGEEAARLGGEQEDDPHHDGERRLVEPVLGDVLEERCRPCRGRRGRRR